MQFAMLGIGKFHLPWLISVWFAGSPCLPFDLFNAVAGCRWPLLTVVCFACLCWQPFALLNVVCHVRRFKAPFALLNTVSIAYPWWMLFSLFMLFAICLGQTPFLTSPCRLPFAMLNAVCFGASGWLIFAVLALGEGHLPFLAIASYHWHC